MEYKDIYSDEFITFINKISKSDTNVIDPDSEVGDYIDVKEILRKCGYTIEESNLENLSGNLNGNVITIDKSEPETRKRFTLGHELGHILQGQVNEQRKDNSDDYDISKRKSEALANNVSAQLLMPENLVRKTIDDVIKEEHFNKKSLGNNELETIINETAKKLQVSVEALTIRVNSLSIFSNTRTEN